MTIPGNWLGIATSLLGSIVLILDRAVQESKKHASVFTLHMLNSIFFIASSRISNFKVAMHSYAHFLQGGAPPVVSWFINPINYRYIIIYHL